MRDTSPLGTEIAAGISRRTFLQVGGAFGVAAALASYTPGAAPANAVASHADAPKPSATAAAERPHRTLLGVL